MPTPERSSRVGISLESRFAKNHRNVIAAVAHMESESCLRNDIEDFNIVQAGHLGLLLAKFDLVALSRRLQVQIEETDKGWYGRDFSQDAQDCDTITGHYFAHLLVKNSLLKFGSNFSSPLLVEGLLGDKSRNVPRFVEEKKAHHIRDYIAGTKINSGLSLAIQRRNADFTIIMNFFEKLEAEMRVLSTQKDLRTNGNNLGFFQDTVMSVFGIYAAQKILVHRVTATPRYSFDSRSDPVSEILKCKNTTRIL